MKRTIQEAVIAEGWIMPPAVMTEEAQEKEAVGVEDAGAAEEG